MVIEINNKNNKLLDNVVDEMNLTQLKLKSKVVITIKKSTKILQAMKQKINKAIVNVTSNLKMVPCVTLLFKIKA